MFLHGDVADRVMNAETLAAARSRWLHHKRRGPVLSRLYDLVVRRFLGSFHPPAVWERVERTSVVAGESFRTRARSLQEPGWRAVLPQSGEEENGAVQLAPLRPGTDAVEDVPVGSNARFLQS